MHTDALGEMSLCLENRPLVEGDLSVLGHPRLEQPWTGWVID